MSDPTLPQVLGVPDPSNPSASVGPVKKRTARAFSRAILASPQYRESLLRRILMDALPSAIEGKLWEYAHGKPVEKLEVKDTTAPLAALSADALEQRAFQLASLASQLRQKVKAAAQDDGAQDDGASVH